MTRSPQRRVLVVLHDHLLTGASIALLRGLPPLEERGWEFCFWVPGPGPACEHLRQRGHRVEGRERPLATSLAGLRLPPGLPRRLAVSGPYLRHFRRYLRSVDPDIVHANTLFCFPEALAARAAGCPTVLHLHDMPTQSRKAPLSRRISRLAADRTLAASAACARAYAHGSWSPTVVHEAASIPEEPAEIRAAPEPFVVGTVGVLSRRKGTDVFVEAAERVLAERPGIELRLVGAATDPLERDWAEGVLARAREVGLTYRERADVEAEMRSWDAFVLPSRRDPFPLAMLEAMALGLPVIGARTDGIPEQLDGGRCGVLVPPEDAAALSRAIIAIADTPGPEREAIGRRARDRVQRHFGPERLADGIEGIYLALPPHLP